jgi:putative phage-type endonuclease
VTAPYTVEAYATREEWLAARTVIGASEVAAALGLSPYESSYALWSRKCGLSVSGPETRAMRRGNVMEPFVASEYAMETGRKLTDLGRWTVCRSTKFPHLSCTPDRIIEPIDDRGPGILEIKSVTNRRAWTEGYIPEHYRVQVVASMVVLGLKWGILAGYVADTDEIIPVEITLDDVQADVLVEVTRDFWRMVEDGRAALARGEQPTQFPDPDASQATADALRQRYAEEIAQDKVPVIETPEARELELEWGDAATWAATVGKRIDACKVKAMTIMQECPEVKLPGGTRVTWKKERNGSRVLRRYAAK